QLCLLDKHQIAQNPRYVSEMSSFDIHTLSVYIEYMNTHRGVITMHKRINITLPEETVRLIDRVTKKGDRSSFIDHAVKEYVEKVGQDKLRKRLKEGALKRAQRDLSVTQEWFTIDEESWQKSKK